MKKQQPKKKAAVLKTKPAKKKAAPAESESRQPALKRLLFGEEKPDLTELEAGSTTILVDTFGNVGCRMSISQSIII